MTVVESRLNKGKLTFGSEGQVLLDVSCQATAVSLVPNHDESGDPVTVLCGEDVAPVRTTTCTMNLTGIQDWTEQDGLIDFSWANDGKLTDFTWLPTEGGPTWTGKVYVQSLTVGGEVNTRLTSDAEWPCQGIPVRKDPAPEPPPDSAKSKKS